MEWWLTPTGAGWMHLSPALHLLTSLVVAITCAWAWMSYQRTRCAWWAVLGSFELLALWIGGNTGL